MTRDHTKFWYLKNIDIFSYLRDEDIRMIDQHSLMLEIKKGGPLFLQGSSIFDAIVGGQSGIKHLKTK